MLGQMLSTAGFAVVWARSRPCLSQPLLAVIHTLRTLGSDLTRGKDQPSPTLSHQRFIKARFSMIFCLFPYSQLVVLTLPVSCQSGSGSQAELQLKWPWAPRERVHVCVSSRGLRLPGTVSSFKGTLVAPGHLKKGTNGR